MSAAGLHANAFTVLQWGDAPNALQLPNNCVYGIQPIWGTFHSTNAAGEFSWGRTWPHWATANFYMQMGSAVVLPNNDLDILTTDAVLAGCF